MKSAKLFKIVKYFQCQYFPFQIRFMFKQSKTFKLSLPTELVQRKFVNKKLNCWLSSMIQVSYYTQLQDIIKLSTSQVATSISKIFTNIKVNIPVPMSIMQLKEIIKLSKMEKSTSLQQDVDEFYGNIINALLNDEMIAQYAKPLF